VTTREETTMSTPDRQGMSRRQLGRLVGGAAAAAAGLGGALGGAPAPARAALVPRAHGPLLTSGFNTWEQANRNAAHNLGKVVTDWGAPGGSWAGNPDAAWSATGQTDFTIVRTGRQGDTWSNLDAGQAVNEIRASRLFEYKSIQKGADKCIIELGNEPNTGCDVNAYAASLSATIDAVRNAFPGARICSSALSPNNFTGVGDSRNPRMWWNNANWVAAVRKCDFVGVHFYSNDGNFANQGAFNEMTYTEVLSWVGSKWPGKSAIATEYSIRNGWDPVSKGRAYANLIHFDGTVAGNLWGATYYHVQIDPWGVDVAENVGSDGAIGYRQRLNEG
jgi:hypothetical protein